MYDPSFDPPAIASSDGGALETPALDGVAASDTASSDALSPSRLVGGGRHKTPAPDRTTNPPHSELTSDDLAGLQDEAGPPEEAAPQDAAEPQDEGALRNRLAAFTLLADVVARAAPAGRGRAAAEIKSVMLRRHGFDETQYGFKTFRLFLRAAAAAGYVVLDEPTVHGKVDVHVRSVTRTAAQAAADHLPIAEPSTGRTPVDQAESAPPVPTLTADGRCGAAPPTAIRQDLWEVFFDWRQDLLRYWDRTQDQAFVLTAEPRRGEPDAVTRRRAEVLQRPGDFVVVDHVTLDQQVQWVRDFVDTLPDVEQAPDLRACVGQARPIAALTRYLREHESLQRKWKAYRQHQVRDAIVTWMGRHGLAIDISGPVPAVRSLPLPSDLRASHGTGVEQAADPRDQILAAIQRMTLADLLRLPIPAEYFLRS